MNEHLAKLASLVVVEDDALANPPQIMTHDDFVVWLTECAADWDDDTNLNEQMHNYTDFSDWIDGSGLISDGLSPSDRLASAIDGNSPEISERNPLGPIHAALQWLRNLLDAD